MTRNGRPAAVLISPDELASLEDTLELLSDPEATRQLDRLPEGTASAIVEFMLGALLDNPHHLGGELQRELAGIRSAHRGAYRIIYEIDESQRLVVVHRIEHWATAYRPR